MKLKAFCFFTFILLIEGVFGQTSSVQSMHLEKHDPSHQESAQMWVKESFGAYNQQNEIYEKRDANSKHFRNSDGTITAIIGAGNLNYQESGQWKTIFHSIESTTNGFRNIHNSFKTFYPSTSAGSIRTKLPNGEEFMDMLNMRMYVQTGTNELEVKNITSSNGNANFNQLTYPNVYGQGIDLRFTQNTNHRKLDYLIHSKSALGSIPINAEWLVFEEKVQIPDGWTAQLVSNLIQVKDLSGLIQFVFEKPVFKDSPIHTHEEELAGNVDHTYCSADHNGHEIIGNYELVQNGNLLTIKTKVPMDWMLDVGRTYPVIIDPTVNCVPDATVQWTGHHITTSTDASYSDGSANFTSTNITSSVDNLMRLGRLDTYKVYNSWMKFNITSVPDNACITSASVNYRISYNYSNDPPNCQLNTRLRQLSSDPSVAFNATNNPIRLADIRDGDIYQTQNLAAGSTGTGWRNVILSSNLTHLTSQLSANWFAVGMNSYSGGSHTSCYLEAYGYNNTDKPYLTVLYMDVTVDAGTDVSICPGASTTLNGSIPSIPTSTTLFSENFEGYGNVVPLPTSGTAWRSTTVTGSTWTWQIENSCSPVGGSRCLNMNDGTSSGGIDCDYTWNDNGDKIAWYGTALNATLYTDLRLNFKWKAYGESGYDYGKVVYSLDGTNWVDLSATVYNVQSNWQTVSNLNISVLNGQQFYLGFRWINDGNTGTAPGFTIDDVSVTGTPVTPAYSWSGTPIVSGGTTLTPTVNPTSTTIYTLTVNFGSCSSSDQVTVILPTMGTTLSGNNETATCLVSGNNWVHFYHNSGRYIGAIHPQGQNLGWVDMTSYVDGTNALVPACSNPSNASLMTSVMQRHWVMVPDNQPSSAVQVGLPFLNAELSNLSSSSTTNANNSDDVLLISDVILSKYHGPSNVNNLATDNCFANGGNENTTIHSQTSNGNLAAVFAGFVNTSYTTHSIPDFSEFWLHGSSNLSPLPITLSSFAAICDESKDEVKLRWLTASEHNSSHFVVERSFDGVVWDELGTKAAAGNSTNSITYEMTDNDVRGYDVIYYRLKQVDLNGQAETFGPTAAECLWKENGFELFPNPAGENVTIQLKGEFDDQSTYVNLEDMNGKIVKQNIYSDQAGKLLQVDLKELAPGVYIVRLIEGTDNVQMVRLIKQ